MKTPSRCRRKSPRPCAAYEELARALPEQRRLGVDESPTKEGGAKSWLWTYVAGLFTVPGILLLFVPPVFPKKADRLIRCRFQQPADIRLAEPLPGEVDEASVIPLPLPLPT